MTYEEFKAQFGLSLNSQQDAAVLSVSGPVLLLAVPGSGKTTVLVSRIGYMIYCLGISPAEILTVTYTRAAAEDMRNRFSAFFGDEYSEKLTFCTINSLSDNILSYYGRVTGKTRFRVADRESAVIAKKVFRAVTGNFPTDGDIRDVLTGTTYAKNMRLNESEIAALDTGIRLFPEIYKAYNSELRTQKLIDYDDQMVYALKILESFPEILSYYRKRFRYFCVDEAQDTSKIQHDIINLLSSETNNLFMVGDEDQSIYGFRAAYPKALTEFEKTHKNASVLYMETNYRSVSSIVSAADRLISHNKTRHAKHMDTVSSIPGICEKIEVRNRSAQLSYLKKVAENLSVDTAVLFRNNESALPLIDILDRNNLPFTIRHGEITFFTHPVVTDILDYIRFSTDPGNAEIFMRLYYKFGAGISKAAAQSVCETSDGKAPLLKEICRLSEISSYTKKECAALLTHFENMKLDDAGKGIYRILNFMGYKEYVNERGMDYGKAEILEMLSRQGGRLLDFPHRLEELRLLMEGKQITGSSGNTAHGSALNPSNDSAHNPTDDSARNPADDSANNPDSASAPEPPAAKKLILSTIHSSKGLEYEQVFLLDMIDGILPGCPEPDNDSSAGLSAYEEERRLYYVAMTRAKSRLYIFTFEKEDTSAFSRSLFGMIKKRSSFSINRRNEGSLYSSKAEVYTPKKIVSDENMASELKKYTEGIEVIHNKYGKGRILSRDNDTVSVFFHTDRKTRKLLLSIAVSTGALKTHF